MGASVEGSWVVLASVMGVGVGGPPDLSVVGAPVVGEVVSGILVVGL